MARLNLTLDPDTFRELDRYTRQLGKPRARVAKELLREGLERRRAAERRRKLAADYVAGRSDARAALRDLEAAQLGLLDDDEA
jgi:4'-phosphopantetheinyl transferase EntD